MEFISKITTVPLNGDGDPAVGTKKNDSGPPSRRDLNRDETNPQSGDGFANLKTTKKRFFEDISKYTKSPDKNMMEFQQKVQRIGKLTPASDLKNDHFAILHDVETIMTDACNNIYEMFDYDDWKSSNGPYPICLFFTQVWNEFKYYNIIFYPMYHGLYNVNTYENRIRRIPGFRSGDYESISSMGYATTELEFIVCSIFANFYMYIDVERIFYAESPESRILVKSIAKMSIDLQHLFTGKASKDEIENITRNIFKFYSLCKFLNDVIGHEEVHGFEIFQSCYTHVLNKIEKNLSDNCFEVKNVFPLLSHIKKHSDDIEDFIRLGCKDPNLRVFDVNDFKNLFSEDSTVLTNGIKDLLSEWYKDFDNNEIKDKILDALSFYSKYDWSSRDWELAFEQFTSNLVSQFDNSSDEKLKTVIKTFDTLIPMVTTIHKICEVINEKNLWKYFISDFKLYGLRSFKRDIGGNYAQYLHYKLRIIPKNKDRNKLEDELQKLKEGVKIFLQLISFGNSLKFKKIYQASFIQRMLNDLLNADFTLFTNISDCELELAKCLDEICKDYQYGISMCEVFEYFQESYKDGVEFTKNNSLNNISELHMISLPQEVDPNNEGESVKLNLPADMLGMMREFKKFTKEKLKLRKNIINPKFNFNMSYLYSRISIDYNIPNNGELTCHLKCNMYHGMILLLFEEDNNIEFEIIVSKLNIPADIALRSLNSLSSEKHPILICEGGGNDGTGSKWYINEKFELSEKMKSAGNHITIVDVVKRR